VFRNFAYLQPEPEAVHAFATKQGALTRMTIGREHPYTVLVKGPGGEMLPAELVSLWQLHIGKMRLAVELWDALSSENGPKLRKLIGWEGKRWKMSMGSYFEDQSVDYEPGNNLRAAGEALRQIVDEELREYVTARLLFLDKSRNSFALHLVPDSLLGAMYLQLAQDTSNGTRFRRCLECGKWFAIRPPTSRATKQFCEEKCRVRAHRRRNRETPS
jgi:hypothetical protein